jgi:hypothetical protein
VYLIKYKYLYLIIKFNNGNILILPIMSFSRNYRLEDPHWAAMYDYAMNEIPNGGYFSEVPHPPSSAMSHPQLLVSDEFSHTSLKRGQLTQNPYTGGLKDFAPGFVTPKLRNHHKNCIENTVNPSACHEAAINKIKEAVHYEEMRNPGFSARRAGLRFPSDLNSSRYKNY